MNNLHRELAPISDAAWDQIEDEATRTIKRYLAARRVEVASDYPIAASLQMPGGKPLSEVAELGARPRELIVIF